MASGTQSQLTQLLDVSPYSQSLWHYDAMNDRTPEGEVITELILETFRLNGVLLDAGNQITKPFGLTSARWQVMGAIDHEGHSMTVAQIARRMGLSRQGVQRIVNDLVKLKVLELEPNLDHKRAPLVLLTKQGIKAIKQINVAQSKWVNNIAEGLNERSLKQALNVLKSIRDGAELP